MTRVVLRSSAFVRAATRLLKRSPDFADNLRNTLQQLSDDAFHPQLKTHKLKGDLAGSWACSVGYDLRIVFEFVQHEETESILLLSLGTHDEVY
ncbi:MAG: type II toxin-antitoxin system mRNA interferase toxin, RelE/StbE family [Candidatus Saccharimonas sp.]|nr:type II toxin-antitoxin system mRNA interferase toxin, RelE/StbE family [Planctomycetaceae bacterium]